MSTPHFQAPTPAHDDAGHVPQAHPDQTMSHDPKNTSGGVDKVDVAGAACPSGPISPQKMEKLDGVTAMPPNGKKNSGVIASAEIGVIDSDETESDDEDESEDEKNTPTFHLTQKTMAAAAADDLSSEEATLQTANEGAEDELELFKAHLARDNQMVEDLAEAIGILVAKAPEWDPSAVANPTSPNEACDLVEFLRNSVQTHVLEKLIIKAQQWGIKWTNFLVYTFNSHKRKHRQLLENPKTAHNHLKRIYKANKQPPVKRGRVGDV